MPCSWLRPWRHPWAGHILLVLAAPVWAWPALGWADVIVLANRTREAIAFDVTVSAEPSRPMQVAPGASVALSLRGPCELAVGGSPGQRRYQLDANAVYVFGKDASGRIDLSQIDLGGSEETSRGRALREGAPTTAVAEIPIEVYVDNYELTIRAVWEARLRQRMERVSRILERHCRVRLKIVEVGQWEASQEAVEFPQALVEFQRRVHPQPGHVAIGFTGRYREPVGLLHLGGTQGMLQSHILVREWSATMSEPEREEVLLHEVGHYLGAVHSPDRASVMRPMLADNQAIRTAFRIEFDPVNTLLLNLVAEEIRERRVTSVSELTAGTRRRLGQIYAKLADAIPDDTSAKQYQFQVAMVGDTPLAGATRTIVAAVRTAAQARATDTTPLQNDRLTEYYVRCAAAAAQTLPAEVAPAALLLGLGIGLDDSETLLQNRLTRDFSLAMETPLERQQRCAALAQPTLWNRRDLAQHFFLSAYLAAVVGSAAAESAGLAKELSDARSGSGFSFADLAADLAGIAFAERLLRREVPLAELASQFEVAGYMPGIEDLPEGLSWDDLAPRLQGTGDQSFAHYYETIRNRLAHVRSAGRTQNKGG